MVESNAGFKGFCSLLAADGAGLIVDSLFRAGGSGFEIPILGNLSGEVVIAQRAVFGFADVADGLVLAVRRAAGVDMGRAGDEVQLLVILILHMVSGVIGEEVVRIVRFACGGKCCSFFGRNADIRAAGESSKFDDRQIAAVHESM